MSTDVNPTGPVQAESLPIVVNMGKNRRLVPRGCKDGIPLIWTELRSLLYQPQLDEAGGQKLDISPGLPGSFHEPRFVRRFQCQNGDRHEDTPMDAVS